MIHFKFFVFMLTSLSSTVELQTAIMQLRSGTGRNPEFIELRRRIKLFQNKRLEFTHHNLLADLSSARAARFFLDKLYCTGDVSARDHQTERVLPKLEKLLPSSALLVLTKVIYMDYLAEYLDDELSNKIMSLHGLIDVDSNQNLYINGFSEQNRWSEREAQIKLIVDVGESLRKLLRLPFLSGLLKMTRGAAQKANLEDFHDFLNEGLEAFSTLKRPGDFFRSIEKEEMVLLDAMKAGTLDRLV